MSDEIRGLVGEGARVTATPDVSVRPLHMHQVLT